MPRIRQHSETTEVEEMYEIVDKYIESHEVRTVRIASGNLNVAVTKSERYLLRFVLSRITLLAVHLAEVSAYSLLFVGA
jgi:sulfur relay (sulfurtransferase) DsrF/TusC family protein